MPSLRNLPIHARLTLAVCVAVGAALLLTVLGMFVIRVITVEQKAERELTATGRTLAARLAPELAVNDFAAAAAMLATLESNPGVARAVIRRADGSEAASFPAAGEKQGRTAGSLAIETPIQHRDRTLGSLSLTAAEFHDDYLVTSSQQGVLALVLLGALGVGLLLSRPLRQSILAPLACLTETARGVVGHGHYSARAEVRGSDEIAKLAELFNQTLERIEELEAREQHHDGELRRLRLELEKEAGERKRAEGLLQDSRQRYEITAVAMLGSSDGLWDWNMAANTIFFSPRWKSMLGFEDHEIPNSYEAWINLVANEDRDRFMKHMDDYLAGRIPTFEIECRMRCKHADAMWTLYRGAALRDSAGKPFRFAGAQTDITARKMAEAGMEQLHRQMVETSRFAGMAEVATGVLHNVGNVLNSVNVSATLISDRLRDSKLADLAAAAALFKERAHDLPAFLANDPKGKVLPGYLRAGLEKLQAGHAEMLRELDSLQRNIGHIKEVVSMQQTYARVSAPTETLTAAELVEEALRLNEPAFQAQPIPIVRKFQDVPPIAVDRHKAVQILVNLLSNAHHAMEGTPATERRIEVVIETNERGAVTIGVRDNGIGIAPENLTRIFRHGFTTRKDGHGFGLHTSANAAKEMGGSLGVWSDGPGKGACFVLELPPAEPALEQKAA
jgi:PAS domain S-box-containing protein